MFHLTTGEVAEKINVPVEKWPGNCYSIAVAIVKANVVKGRAVYGMYHGPVSADSIFNHEHLFQRHGWIEDEDTIIDPTRWVFEASTPYIFTTAKANKDYDMGGNRVREMIMREPPEFNEKDKKFKAPAHIVSIAQIYLNSEKVEFTFPQLLWLCSIPLHLLGKDAKPIYEWAVSIGQEAAIPIDNRLAVLGD